MNSNTSETLLSLISKDGTRKAEIIRPYLTAGTELRCYRYNDTYGTWVRTTDDRGFYITRYGAIFNLEIDAADFVA
jgi:hypothetical protein